MNTENDSNDVKQQFLAHLAKSCAEQFMASDYPYSTFNIQEDFPAKSETPILQLHIRIPAPGCLPQALRPPLGHIPSKEEAFIILRSCPAIENVRLHPKFQRCGFLNALLTELAGRGTRYVNISNIENRSLAQHYLELSRCKGSGVELTSSQTMLFPAMAFPTFSINLRERYLAG